MVEKAVVVTIIKIKKIPQVHPERRPRKYFYSVTHHTHFVQSRLPIENDQITISDMSFNLTYQQ